MSRFLSVTNAMKRVLDKWPAIAAWYEERGRQALRDRNPPDFPLENRQTDLIQVLSILTPVADKKFKSQAERAEQVEVLMALYMTRIDDLAPDQPIPHYLSLTPLASKTRDLLRDALDEHFFSRYYENTKFAACDFVLEMMLKLHPIYKDTQESLNRAVVMCCRQHGKPSKEAVDRLKDVTDKPNYSSASLSRLEARFAPHLAKLVPTSRVDRRSEDELDRWMDDPIGVLRNDHMTPMESVLQYWQRLEQSGEYRIIPTAVRVLFSTPTSSYQIEHDFSVSGEMASPQRSSLAGDSTDMCIFLNRNTEFVNLLQCEEIPRG
ncbi:hypothetical protein PHPALM_28041 [Phytophthora palmivora]|uniref:HAT C-terminal dimerisation domain-containing protein n=1 Tax=Phytophthora palmivora TaxID=4796 RepID=A0A2P4XB66_9STRA|nr:hypothetical protein PHPALM_28041 [Phytophthora palmivora]